MAHPSGSCTLACPFCHFRYKLTNWMVRRGLKVNGVYVADTHQAACIKRTPEERKRWYEGR